MDFVAFDFETANSRADSACQLAVVRVREGSVVAERCWHIRPPRLYFSSRNISIHGIRPEHVIDSATMEALWPELVEFVDGELMVAHNASFDVRVLVASLAAFDVACPAIEFSCTRAIARRAWPGRSGYGLKPLGNWLGIDFRHHDALEDARCCARIALAAASTIEATVFPELEKRLRLSRGRYSLGRIQSPRMLSGFAASTVAQGTSRYVADAGPVPPSHSLTTVTTGEPVFAGRRPTGRGQIDPQSVMDAAGGSQPLSGKQIVCLGSLRGLDAAETQRLIEALGAQWQTQISSATDYVIACGGTFIQDANQVIAQTRLTPEFPPLTEPVATKSIRVLSERQFLALLPGGKAAVRW